MPSLSALSIAFFGGLIPAVLWLFFWLREDRCHPEPKRLIFFSFLAGMLAVPLVLPFEHVASAYVSGNATIVLWAALEETFKYIGAMAVVLWRKEVDEPIDALIYMISAALGFAAFENALFLLGPLQDGSAVQSILTGNLRFIGAALLHTLASATVGLGIAYAFYRGKAAKRVFPVLALILAVLLHAVFNFLIMDAQGGGLFRAFLFVWSGIVALLLVFEIFRASSRDYC
jgi:protease PrsW